MPRRLARLVSRVESGTLRIGIVPREVEQLEAVARSLANRLGAAIIIAALVVASALMARVNERWHWWASASPVLLGLFELWKIFRTPGDL